MIAIGAIIFLIIFKEWKNIQASSMLIHTQVITFSIISLVFFNASVMTTGILWGGILKKYSRGAKISFLDQIYVQITAWLLKYLPGQIGAFLYKLSWGQYKQISKKAIFLSYIYENIFLIFSALLLSVPILLGYSFNSILKINLVYLSPLIFLPFIILFINQRFFDFCLNLFSRLTNKNFKYTHSFYNSTEIILNVFKFIIPRILAGSGFLLIIISFLKISALSYPNIIAIYVFSGIIGTLCFFVPGGLGVREALITLFLSQYTNLATAAFLAIYARCITVFSDLILLIVWFILNKVKVNI